MKAMKKRLSAAVPGLVAQGRQRAVSPPQILLVEGEEEEARRICSVLRVAGYRVLRLGMAATEAAGWVAPTQPHVALISTARLPLSPKAPAVQRIEARLGIPVLWMLPGEQADWAERIHQVSKGACLVRRFSDHQLVSVVEWAMQRWHRTRPPALKEHDAVCRRNADRVVSPMSLMASHANSAAQCAADQPGSANSVGIKEPSAPTKGLLFCDLSLKCTAWDQGMTEFTGFTQDEAHGRPVPELLLRAGFQGAKILLQDAAAGHHFLTKPLWRDGAQAGRPGWFTLACRPRLGPKDRPAGVILELQRAQNEQEEHSRIRQLLRVNRVNEFIRETLDCHTYGALARECCRILASLANSRLVFIRSPAGAPGGFPQWRFCSDSAVGGRPADCVEMLKLPEVRACCDRAVADGKPSILRLPASRAGAPTTAPASLQGLMITRIALGNHPVALFGAAAHREFAPADLEDLMAMSEAFARVAQYRNLLNTVRKRPTAGSRLLSAAVVPGSPDPAGTDSASVKPLLAPPPYPGLLGMIGRYHLLTYAGEGGAGIVFQAHDTEEPRQVALKLLRPARSLPGCVSAGGQADIRTMADLSHPRIVPVLDFSDTPERTYLVMPWMAGGNLASSIASARLSPRRVVRVALQVAAGLAFLHGHGIMHRDVKPTNVLLDRAGNASLADFGLARSFMDAGMLTEQPWVIQGTVNYLSPALARGQAEDTRGDIYAFGALLYEMLAGRPPYAGARPSEVLEQIRQGPPPPIRTLNSQASPGLVSIAERAMARELEHRYGHMAYVTRDLKKESRSLR